MTVIPAAAAAAVARAGAQLSRCDPPDGLAIGCGVMGTSASGTSVEGALSVPETKLYYWASNRREKFSIFVS